MARAVGKAAVPLTAASIAVMVLAGAYAMGAHAPAGTPRVVATWGTASDRGRPDAVEVVGVTRSTLRGLRSLSPADTAWRRVLRVVVGEPSNEAMPAVIGSYSVRGDRIRFEPRFPFAPGVAYDVEFDAANVATLSPNGVVVTPPRITYRFNVPAVTHARSTRVLAVHPTADRVPSNMLRWYVEFSAPMEPGTALEHVRLLDETGRPVEQAFLRVGEELWDPARRRLTLLFDPGRVKRGVRTNLEMGRPLVAGHRYRLVIDGGWRDARGAALASGFEKEFDAAPVDGTSPDPARWQLTVPRAGTLEPLRVAFGEPLDHALARRMMSVVRGARTVDGEVELAGGDSLWRFVPASPWAPGKYELRVAAALEDLAGNSVARVFDADRHGGAPRAEARAQAGRSRAITVQIDSPRLVAHGLSRFR